MTFVPFTDRKRATQAAIALITAVCTDGVPAGRILADVLAEDMDVTLLVSTLLALVHAVLVGVDEVSPGFTSRWLAGVGRSVEAMQG